MLKSNNIFCDQYNSLELNVTFLLPNIIRTAALKNWDAISVLFIAFVVECNTLNNFSKNILQL